MLKERKAKGYLFKSRVYVRNHVKEFGGMRPLMARGGFRSVCPRGYHGHAG